MDKVSRDQRSKNMAAVLAKNTSPELRVRSALHVIGYRFRLHRSDLPGKPDIVLPRYRVSIFVHGCFWHQHARCKRASIPQTHKAFWMQKFSENKRRDTLAQKELRKLGWQVYIIWECQTKTHDKLTKTMRSIFAKIEGAKESS